MDFMAGPPAIGQVADILQDPQRGATLAKDCEEPAGVDTLKGFGKISEEGQCGWRPRKKRILSIEEVKRCFLNVIHERLRG